MTYNSITKRRPRIGLFLPASPRFRELGAGTDRGSFDSRKNNDAKVLVTHMSAFSEVINPGVIYERRQVDEAIQSFFSRRVDCVVVKFLSWSEDFTWIRFLRDMPQIPIFFCYSARAERGFTDTIEEDDFIEFLSAGGLVGSLEASGSIRRIGREAVRVVAGDREHVLKRLRDFAEAACAASELNYSRFGLLASYNELMWSTYIDPFYIFTRLGPELQFIPVTALEEETEAVKQSDLDAYVKVLRNLYKMEPDVDQEMFLQSVKSSLGLRNLVQSRGLQALALNDVDHYLFKQIGLRPGFYHPDLNDTGSVIVPEADLGAAYITWVLKQMSGQQVNFVEPFFVDESEGTFAAGHAGPNDYTDHSGNTNVRIARDVRFAKTNYRYAGAPFAWYRITPGMKTFAHFSENGGKYKMVTFLAESIDGDHIISSFCHSTFKPSIPSRELFEQILNIGTTQHFAVVDGDIRQRLGEFAFIKGFEYHQID